MMSGQTKRATSQDAALYILIASSLTSQEAETENPHPSHKPRFRFSADFMMNPPAMTRNHLVLAMLEFVSFLPGLHLGNPLLY